MRGEERAAALRFAPVARKGVGHLLDVLGKVCTVGVQHPVCRWSRQWSPQGRRVREGAAYWGNI